MVVFAMDSSPEITSCNNNDRLASVVHSDLVKSLRESNDATLHAQEAWMQLERLATHVRFVGSVADLLDREGLFEAFKDCKLLTRDRLVWQAMGWFRTPLDLHLATDHLSGLVKEDSAQASQLRTSYYKTQSDVLLTISRTTTRSSSCSTSVAWWSWTCSTGITHLIGDALSRALPDGMAAWCRARRAH